MNRDDFVILEDEISLDESRLGVTLSLSHT